MQPCSRPVVAFAAMFWLCVPAHADERADRVGHRPTAWAAKEFAAHRSRAMAFGDAYRGFLGRHKTEREVASAAVAMAKKSGYRDLFAARRPRLVPGARVYATHHGTQVAFAVVGTEPLERGVRVVAAHIDSVRIDLKPTPLYGDGNVAWLQTQYYGRIKSYQWLSQPLELRGVVVKKSGDTVRVAIGDDADEPVLVIPDVAMHMARGVDAREGEEVPGEALDPVLASTPAARVEAGADPFAAAAEQLLAREYGVGPGDLLAAELELVPAVQPRDVGLDRALIGGYGHDDRAGAYAAVRALLDVKRPEHTAVVVLVDKAEVGSAGVTGARSSFVRRVVAELIEGTGRASTGLAVDRVLSASMVLTADATGAANAQYPDLYEPRNATYLGAGVAWDRRAASAELAAYLHGLFDRSGIVHQPAMRRPGNGPVAGDSVLAFFTRHGMSGVDLSIPLLSMHAPFELISKADLYEAYRAYRAFLAD